MHWCWCDHLFSKKPLSGNQICFTIILKTHCLSCKMVLKKENNHFQFYFYHLNFLTIINSALEWKIYWWLMTWLIITVSRSGDQRFMTVEEKIKINHQGVSYGAALWFTVNLNSKLCTEHIRNPAKTWLMVYSAHLHTLTYTVWSLKETHTPSLPAVYKMDWSGDILEVIHLISSIRYDLRLYNEPILQLISN